MFLIVLSSVPAPWNSWTPMWQNRGSNEWTYQRDQSGQPLLEPITAEITIPGGPGRLGYYLVDKWTGTASRFFISKWLEVQPNMKYNYIVATGEFQLMGEHLP